MRPPLLLPALVAVLLAAPSLARWPGWGGPGRDFTVPGVALADTWPETGPRRLWERELGNGHAAVVFDQGVLFAMHGDGRNEHVVAIAADSGRTLWDRAYPVGYRAHREDWDGPHATPLIAGDRLVAVSIDARVRAFDRRTGEVVWTRDLVGEHDVTLPQSGYAASPLLAGARHDEDGRPVDGLVLLPGLGGEGPGALALSLKDGRTVWARHDFLSSHASPTLVGALAVFHGMNRLVALDPATGDVRWEETLRGNAADNVSFTPLWDARRRQIVVSHRYDSVGARALRLRGDEAPPGVEPAWTNRRLMVEHGNGVLLDGVLYGSHRGDPAFLAAVDLEDGKLLWSERRPKSTLLAVGGKLLMLDEDGVLHLARPDASGSGILASAKILDYNAWTVPTVVGKRLFARDRKRLVALELP